MRRAIALIAVLAGVALLAAAAMPADAQQGPPGFNGTIKIHSGDLESEPIRANEPHPGCTFHIHGFNFDPGSSGTWSIQAWPPTGERQVVASGSWGPASGNGDWRTGVMSAQGWPMEDGRGHFKANVDQTSPSAPGGEKHKVFWAECGPAAGAQESPAGQAASPSPTQLGLQQAPQQAAVAPIVEAPAQQQQAAAQQQVAGQQAAPIQALPSTSTAPMEPMLMSGLLMGISTWILRRRSGER